MNLLGASVSGLMAAQTRLSASATNISNQFSTSQVRDGVTINEPFQPVQAVATSLEPNGVTSEIVPDDSRPLLVFDPTNSQADEDGIVALPNVDLGSEVVEQLLARQQFFANLQVLERADDALGQLLDQSS